jgi:hypothetical protein
LEIDVGKYYEIRLVMLEWREDDEVEDPSDLIGQAISAAFDSDCIAEIHVDNKRIFETTMPGYELRSFASE